MFLLVDLYEGGGEEINSVVDVEIDVVVVDDADDENGKNPEFETKMKITAIQTNKVIFLGVKKSEEGSSETGIFLKFVKQNFF